MRKLEPNISTDEQSVRKWERISRYHREITIALWAAILLLLYAAFRPFTPGGFFAREFFKLVVFFLYQLALSLFLSYTADFELYLDRLKAFFLLGCLWVWSFVLMLLTAAVAFCEWLMWPTAILLPATCLLCGIVLIKYEMHFWGAVACGLSVLVGLTPFIVYAWSIGTI